MSTGTVSAMLNHPTSVTEDHPRSVQLAVTDLGYLPGGRPAESAPHWRHNGFATWLSR